MTESSTSVYKYFDARGAIIYVGITNQGIGRNRQHNATQDWWPFVAYQEVEHLDSREEALDREKQLIRQFRPPFNKQHNPDHAAFRDAYLVAFGEAESEPVIPLAELKKNLSFKHLELHIVARNDEMLILTTPVKYAELIAAISWPHSDARLLLDGGVAGRLRQKLQTKSSLTLHFELREEIDVIDVAYLGLKRIVNAGYRINCIRLEGTRDPVVQERHRYEKYLKAKRYGTKMPRNAVTTWTPGGAA